MKYCPSCGTQYTDDTLRFCLQEGSQLRSTDAPEPTVVLDETPTVMRQRAPVPETREDIGPAAKPPSTEGTRLIPFLIAGLLGVVLFIAGAAAAWFFLSDAGFEAANTNSVDHTDRKSPSTPGNTNMIANSPTPGPSPAKTGTPQAAPAPEIEQARRDVSHLIEQWRSNTEALDVEAYMANYAGTVDYYNRRGASKATVRADKHRAFEIYDSVRMEISNVDITVDETAERATAEFDKEWDFRGSRRSRGKVRSQLQLKREGDRWMINGERDIRVYYVN